MSINPKQAGSILIIVLLLSALSAATLLFSWNSAILQNKMACNYVESVQALAKAEESLNQVEAVFVRDLRVGSYLGFKSLGESEQSLAGMYYYRIYSDPNFKVRLQAVVEVERDEIGEIKKVKRKTWEEMGA